MMTDDDQKIAELEAALAQSRSELEVRTEELENERDRAAAADSAKATFLATLSHELRTPLNAIIGFSELMHSEQLGPVGTDQYKTYLKDITDSGRHLLSLVDDLLDVSRMQSGKIDFQDVEVDPVELIHSVVRLLGPDARKGSVRTDIRLSPGLGHILGDERALRQMLINIVSNAIRYSKESGHVVIAARIENDDSLTLTVSDNGIGIAEDKIQKVFAPFFQGSSTLSRSHGGAGLGLAIARSMVEHHDGEISLQSEEGVGTSVTIRFPARRIVHNDAEDDMTQFDDDDDSVDMSVCLRVTHNGHQNLIYQDGGEFVIGRPDPRRPDLICDLSLSDPRISRPHARIIHSQGHFYLVDQSRRGCYVVRHDGGTEFVHQNSSAPLDHGGRILLGDGPGTAGVPSIEFELSETGDQSNSNTLMAAS
ncbi:ATP-binding protein [Minwuia sp.]|uniref:sensor histidine kinase n=1 Tax=Minwuia sp. TaxID=2493630 RepID=UPI003A8F7B56